MSLSVWLLIFILHSLFSWWIIGFGGAKWVEGWKAFFLIDWFTLDWNSEQIRLYVLILWIVSSVWFIVGVFRPELRVF